MGPEEVRAAVLDAAVRLFACHGVDRVSLRDIAAAAEVQLTLIGRYIGPRDELVDEVYRHLCRLVVAEIESRPLGPRSFDRGSSFWAWIVLFTHYSMVGQPLPPDALDPVGRQAELITELFGIDERTARLRSVQVVALAVGWRIFEPNLLALGHLDGDLSLDEVRRDLNLVNRMVAATPWPTPDPPLAADG